MKDHRIDIYLDAVMYTALKAGSEETERSISAHVRFLLKKDIDEALDKEEESATGEEREQRGK